MRAISLHQPFASAIALGLTIENGRNAILIELNPAHAPLIFERTRVTPTFF